MKYLILILPLAGCMKLDPATTGTITAANGYMVTISAPLNTGPDGYAAPTPAMQSLANRACKGRAEYTGITHPPGYETGPAAWYLGYNFLCGGNT